jgi:hypothetical protein
MRLVKPIEVATPAQGQPLEVRLAALLEKAEMHRIEAFSPSRTTSTRASKRERLDAPWPKTSNDGDRISAELKRHIGLNRKIKQTGTTFASALTAA